MCEINPKHARYFRLEAFTSNPTMTKEEFEREVMEKVFGAEQLLNTDGRFRFHVHETEPLKGEGLNEEVQVTLTKRELDGIIAVCGIGQSMLGGPSPGPACMVMASINRNQYIAGIRKMMIALDPESYDKTIAGNN